MTEHIEKMGLKELRRHAIDLQEENDRLRRNLSEDLLTGAYNRRGFERFLANEHARLVREGTPLSVLYMDLDGFKLINDQHGHAVGDLLLRAVCDRISMCIRSTDALCRVGGDEFTVILHNTRVDRTRNIAERIAKKIASEPFTLEGATEDISVSLCIGGVNTNDPGVSTEELVRASDRLMYEAKATFKASDMQDVGNAANGCVCVELLPAS